ncbi:MAG: HipA domain-containing protein [Chitinophagales bacterium]|nr:HipA domain-containing protein [Bacteroidota bacterium]MBK8486385.1 HipA domain-containing protein [Bacteroidota bacterium]MBK8683165.1 HipA domain-containing protein [Bacteroidota bacterium]
MTKAQKEILVYAHWKGMVKPMQMGILNATSMKGKETFSFKFTESWISSGYSQMIDPDLQLFSGAFYPANEKSNFGIFLDSCPDRWGRVLMQRHESALAKLEGRNAKKLLESDFLMGVFDQHRMGALRFKIDEMGPFLNDNKNMASPPWTSLQTLEQASLKFEDEKVDDPQYLKWINLLIAPGSSLGGARPKASVVDAKNNLWIAKFPSKSDEKDIAVWEMLTNDLAVKAGLNMAEGRIQKFKNKYHTYLTKRFDRNAKGERIHFASAMTLLGYSDGAGSEGASYLDLVEFISKNGANIETDLEELWRRIVFSICVKNTDDHLRNHGFLLTDKGWILSPAYDINPNEFGTGLSVNIYENDNALDIDLALEVAPYFRLNNSTTQQIIKKIHASVKTWRKLSSKYGITRTEQERMASAFE